MILLLDNYDSFTYNLRDYFSQLGVFCKVFRNDVDPFEIFSHSYKGVVLSPGPGRPASAGCLMQILENYASKIPVLGICLGHQAIGEYFGAGLERAEIPMHGKISSIYQKDSIIFKNMQEKLSVVRYHSLVLKDLPACLIKTAWTAKDEIMAIQHKTLPINGLQFHPEAILTENGLEMLHNWIRFYHIAN